MKELASFTIGLIMMREWAKEYGVVGFADAQGEENGGEGGTRPWPRDVGM